MSPEPTTGGDVAGTANVGTIVPGVSGTANVGMVVPGVTVLGLTEPGGAAFTGDCVDAVDGTDDGADCVGAIDGTDAGADCVGDVYGAGDGASLRIVEGVAVG